MKRMRIMLIVLLVVGIGVVAVLVLNSVANRPREPFSLTVEHDDKVLEAVWNADETRILSVSSDNTVRVWDAVTGETLLTVSHEGVRDAEWSPDETRILTRAGMSLKVWDATTGTRLFEFYRGVDINSAVWSPDGTRLVIAMWNSTAQVVDVAQAAAEATPEATADMTPESTEAAGVGTVATPIPETAPGVVLTLQHEADSNVWQAAWNATGTQITTRCSDKTARIWDAASGEELVVLRHEGRVEGFVWNQDYSLLLTLNNADFSFLGFADGNTFDQYMLRVWDVATGEERLALEHPDVISGAAWNSDETRILTWSMDNHARVWDVASGEELLVLAHQSNVRGATWNSDETRILTWASDGFAKVWDAASGEELLAMRHRGPVSHAEWNADETRIIILDNSVSFCSRDCEHAVWIWDATSGEALFTLADDAPVYAPQLSADEFLLMTSAGNTVDVRDVSAINMPVLALAEPLAVRPGHWAGEPNVSFDVTEDLQITNFHTSFPFGGGFSTCTMDAPGEFFEMLAGEVVQIAGFDGQFVTETSLTGTYLVYVCGGTISVGGGPVAWSAEWVSEQP